MKSWSGTARPVGWEEGKGANQELRDGDVFQMAGRVLRVYLPTPLPVTDRGELGVGHESCRLEIDPKALKVTFAARQTEATLSGVPVRALMV